MLAIGLPAFLLLDVQEKRRRKKKTIPGEEEEGLFCLFAELPFFSSFLLFLLSFKHKSGIQYSVSFLFVSSLFLFSLPLFLFFLSHTISLSLSLRRERRKKERRDRRSQGSPLRLDDDDDDDLNIDTSHMTQEEKNELKAQRKVRKMNREKLKRSRVNDQFDHLCKVNPTCCIGCCRTRRNIIKQRVVLGC